MFFPQLKRNNITSQTLGKAITYAGLSDVSKSIWYSLKFYLTPTRSQALCNDPSLEMVEFLQLLQKSHARTALPAHLCATLSLHWEPCTKVAAAGKTSASSLRKGALHVIPQHEIFQSFVLSTLQWTQSSYLTEWHSFTSLSAKNLTGTNQFPPSLSSNYSSIKYGSFFVFQHISALPCNRNVINERVILWDIQAREDPTLESEYPEVAQIKQ